MTGFGRGESTANGLQITAEIKTLNSRYLEITVRTPKTLQDKEFDIKELLQKEIQRGKVQVSVNLEQSTEQKPEIIFNEERVKVYGAVLEQIRYLANIQEPVQLSDLLQFDDIFERKQEETDEVEMIWKSTRQALHKAALLMNAMRAQEGEELKKELNLQINGISEMIDEVARITDKRIPEVRERLQGRISTLIGDEKIDRDRLEMEIALIADKMDINEEIIRLRSHLKFFLEALENEQAVGRRLNFLCQEINRELNTIGSKAGDSSIAHLVVIGKEKLEQIREQVQNIE